MTDADDSESTTLGVHAVSSLWERAATHEDRIAVVDADGAHRYSALLDESGKAAQTMLGGSDDLRGARVAFMVAPSFDHVLVQWGIWRAGGVAVPLCLSHPAAELAQVLDDALPHIVVGEAAYADVLRPLADQRGIRWLTPDDLVGVPKTTLPTVDESRPALMIYTSGTTGRPKGVVTTHRNVIAQVRSLVDAWEWTVDDRIVLDLPLHHLHGILNVVSCALWSGATCEMHPRFDAVATWERLASGDLTLYMAVPTIYRRLIDQWERSSPTEQARFTEGARSLRLMVSGSAALPVPTLERWYEVCGHTLLERYGMSELGMALSNPLHGERQAGSVGFALPGVEVRLIDEDGARVEAGVPGEIQVRGETVFEEYWRRPEATVEAFTDDGWFMTGDIATCENGRYRILGRSSVDILKTGGEKVSALEVENVLLGHDDVDECAVVGIDDPDWGQRIVAVVVTRSTSIDEASLREWCRHRLAPFKIPKQVLFFPEIERNPMGKVVKPALIERINSE